MLLLDLGLQGRDLGVDEAVARVRKVGLFVGLGLCKIEPKPWTMPRSTIHLRTTTLKAQKAFDQSKAMMSPSSYAGGTRETPP
jgi:hypothetical protein